MKQEIYHQKESLPGKISIDAERNIKKIHNNEGEVTKNNNKNKFNFLKTQLWIIEIIN